MSLSLCCGRTRKLNIIYFDHEWNSTHNEFEQAMFRLELLFLLEVQCYIYETLYCVYIKNKTWELSCAVNSWAFKNQTLQHHSPFCKQYIMQHVLSFPGTMEDAMSLYGELISLIEGQTYEHIHLS